MTSRGHIRKVGDRRWQIIFDIAPDPVTGRRRQRSRTVRGGREDAERERQRIVAELGEGTWADGGSMRLAEFLEMFREARGRQKEWAPGTRAWYEQKHAYVVEAMGHRRLSQITAGGLEVLYGRLLERGLSPTTVSHVHAAVRAALNAAVRWGYLRSNPALRAEPPGRSTAEAAAWTAADLRRFLEAAAETPWLVAWTLLAATGMRRSEVAGLKWANVDLDGRVLHVRQALKSTGGRLEWGAPKTPRSRRTVALDEATVELLSAHRRSQLTDRMRSEGAYEDHDLVVAWPDGRPVNPDVLSKNFRRLVDRLGLPYIRLHDLRHTWATLALEAGVELKVVSQRLGHSSIKVTADVYTHVVESVDRDAAETVAQVIREGSTRTL